MQPKPILGVDVDDFRLPAKDALRRASELDFHIVELSAASGDVTPHRLSESGRRHLIRYVEGLGLRIHALCADLPGLRLTDSRGVEERVERTCQILQLGRELGVKLVTASVGALTHPESGVPSAVAIQALQKIGEFADSRGVVYALRPSHDDADRLARVLDELRCPSIRVGLDPAALLMTGANPLALVERLAGQVSMVHARDGTLGSADRCGRETTLGEGEVDWVGLTAMLRDSDYTGAYILRRLDSQTPQADLAQSRDALARYLTVR